ncbi:MULTISPECIES: DMT family transporter [Bacillus cereus group]|uniref:EamA/RhaT family transporter n=1 Tax=Bacillus cereus TaxID=1396 RepID=A0AA44Q7K0_BACCE|nr:MULTISPECIES: DMT family transporter [Bacillus cereus group]EEL51949.1 Transporter, EamA [Bacillus cereus Rock3-44]PFN08511.1 EamA/RhaT family transporter [Bacillus cereus]PFO77771.1 EamA/RhaT family transporter [Bacillus cereus]PFR27153.1 EamA/RhaT family transporter [Bacillus cereus]PFR97191.1 EamA/RhaT family transporter [Bacillus cereus]
MPYFYVFLLLLTSLLWGGNFVVGKSLVDHASPMTLTSLRWIIAVLCLFPIVWLKEKRLFPPRAAILPLLIMGVTGVVLFNIFQFLALEQTSATNVGLISTLNAISIALFSSLFLKEKINRFQILSMILSFFGVLLVLSKGNIALLFSLQFNSGDLWMIAAVCIWGIYSVCSKWATKTTSPMMATLYSGVFGVMILLPFNMPDFTVSHIDASFITSLLYTGLISTVVCMVFWNIGVQKLGATTAGIFLNFNPIFTAILAFLFLGEALTWVQILGTVIVVSGCYLFSHFKTAVPRAHTSLARSH